jgi:TRAP-type C4-dicarboxylate transport system permease small subunit
MNALGHVVLSVLRAMVVLCVAGMVVLVFANVVLRYGFNSGISISEEMSRYFFVWLIFVGAIVAMHQRTHLGVDSLVSRLPRKAKVVCNVVGDLLMLGCCILLLVGSWKQTVVNMGNLSPVSGVPIGWMHAAALLSSVGLIAVVGRHMWRVLSGRASEQELVQGVDSEECQHAGPTAEASR